MPCQPGEEVFLTTRLISGMKLTGFPCWDEKISVRRNGGSFVRPSHRRGVFSALTQQKELQNSPVWTGVSEMALMRASAEAGKPQHSSILVLRRRAAPRVWDPQFKLVRIRLARALTASSWRATSCGATDMGTDSPGAGIPPPEL